MKYCLSAIALIFVSVSGYSQQSIDSKNISNYVNDSVRVIGKVTNAYNSQSVNATILEVVINGTSTFDVVIKNEDRNKFKFTSESEFVSKTVAVTGKVVQSSGRHKINITSNEQLSLILGDRVQ